MSKSDPDDKKTCKQLVRGRCANMMERLKILSAARRIGDRTYDKIKEISDRREAFVEKYPKSPMRDPKVVASEKEFYRDEKAEIQLLIDEFSNDELFVFKNIGDVECYGGCDGLMTYGASFSYTEYDRKHDYGGFFMWLLYGGGPSGELQFYTELDSPDFTLRKIKFHYKDWFDGAGLELSGDWLKTGEFIYEYFKDAGMFESAYAEYMRNNKIPVGHTSDR